MGWVERVQIPSEEVLGALGDVFKEWYVVHIDLPRPKSSVHADGSGQLDFLYSKALRRFPSSPAQESAPSFNTNHIYPNTTCLGLAYLHIDHQVKHRSKTETNHPWDRSGYVSVGRTRRSERHTWVERNTRRCLPTSSIRRKKTPRVGSGGAKTSTPASSVRPGG